MGNFISWLLVGRRAPIWKRSVHSLAFLKDMFTNPLRTVLEYLSLGIWYNSTKQCLVHNHSGILAGINATVILLTQKRVTLDLSVDYGKAPLSWIRALFDYAGVELDTGGDQEELKMVSLGGISSFRSFIADAADFTVDEQVSWMYSLRRRFTLLMVLLFIPIVIVLPIIAIGLDGAEEIAVFYGVFVLLSVWLDAFRLGDDVRRVIARLPNVLEMAILIILALVIPYLAYRSLDQLVWVPFAVKVIVGYFVLLKIFGK